MNNSGIHDSSLGLHISINEVVQVLKSIPRCPTTFLLDIQEVGLICEVDEQWSFVGNKNTPRWL